MGVGTPDPVWPALIASIAPVVVGAVSTHLKLFIESESDFRKRISFQRKERIEGFAGRVASVLQHVRRMTEDDVLRGDGREEPDLVGDVAKECYKLCTVLHRMEMIRAVVRIAYSVLCVSIGVGILGVVLSWLWVDSRPYVFGAAIATTLFQVALVLGVMRASSVLEVYEDVA